MLPIPIPDHLVPPWGVRRTISPPDGDLLNDEIRACDAIVGPLKNDDGQLGLSYTVLVQMEDGDMEAIEQAGGLFTLTFVGHMVPFSLSVLEPLSEGDDT